MNLTADLLARALAVPVSRMMSRVGPLGDAIKYADLTTGLRFSHYIGQVGHESGRFRYVREIWGPTAAQKRYERDFSAPWPSTPERSRLKAFATNRLAYALGNDRAGDGLRYMGRGDIQTTGRGNYRRLTQRLRARGIDCPDFEASPTLIEQQPWCTLAAADYWVMRNINQWADIDDIYTVTKRVNGGSNGLADRQAIQTSMRMVLMKENLWI